MNEMNDANVPDQADNGLNINFNVQLNAMVSRREYAGARGKILAALQLAQANCDAPEAVVAGLVRAYTGILDTEMTHILANAKLGLAEVGISEADVRRHLTDAVSSVGGQHGSTH